MSLQYADLVVCTDERGTETAILDMEDLRTTLSLQSSETSTESFKTV
jgi:hypothetical protein